jgi:hypothetical protein
LGLFSGKRKFPACFARHSVTDRSPSISATEIGAAPVAAVNQEIIMAKTCFAFLTLILAATAMLASTAEAGSKVRLGFGFPLGSFTAHGNSSYGKSGGAKKKLRRTGRHQVRRTRDDLAATKKSTGTKPVAKADPEPQAAPAPEAAATENSSISSATAVQPDAGPEATPPAETGCKQFFPSVGTTLTVPCE